MAVVLTRKRRGRFGYRDPEEAQRKGFSAEIPDLPQQKDFQKTLWELDNPPPPPRIQRGPVHSV